MGTAYLYGAFGVLTSVTRSDGTGRNSRVTTLKHDGLGRRTLLVDPDTGSRTRLYNAFGDVREEDDAQGDKDVNTLDALGRPTEKTDKDGLTSFAWDAPLTGSNGKGKGKLAETTSPFGVRRQFFHDGSGRLNQEIWRDGD